MMRLAASMARVACAVFVAVGVLPAQMPSLGPPKPAWQSQITPAVRARADSLRVVVREMSRAKRDSESVRPAEMRATLLGDTAVAYAVEYSGAQFDLAVVYDAVGRSHEAFACLVAAGRSYLRIPTVVTQRQYALIAAAMALYARTHAERETALAVGAPLLDAMRSTLDSAEWTTPEQALATLYLSAGKEAQAESLLRGAIDRTARVSGVGSAEHVRALKFLVTIYGDMRMAPQGEALVRRYMEFVERATPRVDTTYAADLTVAAKAFAAAELIAPADSLFRAALVAQRRGGATEARTYYETLAAHGKLQFTNLDVLSAISTLRQSIDGFRRHPVPRDALLVNALVSLESALMLSGDYSAAGSALDEAASVARAYAGEQSTVYVQLLLRKVAFQSTIVGDSPRAREVLLESARLLFATIGNDVARYSEADAELYAELQGAKSDLNARWGQYDFAAIAADSAVRILELVRGPLARGTLLAVNRLAGVYSSAGRTAEADSVLVILEARYRQVTGPLARLGRMQVLARRSASAVARGDQRAVIELNRREHDDIARDFPGIAGLSTYTRTIAAAEAALGLRDEAMRDVSAALREETSDFARVSGFTSARELAGRAASLQAFPVAAVVNLALQRPAGSSARAADADSALTWVLRTRGLILSTMSQFRRLQYAQAHDPTVEKLVTSVRATRARIGSLALSGGGDSLQRLRTSLVVAAEQGDAQLARALGGAHAPASAGDVATVTASSVRERLGEGSALIEFLRIGDIDFGEQGRPGVESGKSRYVAFVARARRHTVLVDLGDADAIDAAVRDVREAERAATDLEGFRQASASLRAMVFTPIEPALRDLPRRRGVPPTLYLVADGELTRVPFEALVDASGKLLIDQFAIAYLSSGRDLLLPVEPLATGTVVFAGPDYNMAPSSRARTVGTMGASTTTTPGAISQNNTAARDLRGQAWTPLAGAAAESEDITRMLQRTEYGPTTTHVGVDALEDRLYAMPAPRVLHLATHGFFVPGVAMSPEDRARCNEPVPPSLPGDAVAGAARGMDRLRCADDPLLRSGIVLAGANTVGDSASSGVADGWVLAAEIAGMDLHGTELVVLSACETGLGDVRVGEGVYGLRRAFELAGARNVLMSLFKVPDAETRELLADFYRGLARGLKPGAAFRSAQLSQRARHPHPLYWASFVLVGRN